jgi:hypothetical protein
MISLMIIDALAGRQTKAAKKATRAIRLKWRIWR